MYSNMEVKTGKFNYNPCSLVSAPSQRMGDLGLYETRWIKIRDSGESSSQICLDPEYWVGHFSAKNSSASFWTGGTSVPVAVDTCWWLLAGSWNWLWNITGLFPSPQFVSCWVCYFWYHWFTVLLAPPNPSSSLTPLFYQPFYLSCHRRPSVISIKILLQIFKDGETRIPSLSLCGGETVEGRQREDEVLEEVGTLS